jgi:hypothetical protein
MLRQVAADETCAAGDGDMHLRYLKLPLARQGVSFYTRSASGLDH